MNQKIEPVGTIHGLIVMIPESAQASRLGHHFPRLHPQGVYNKSQIFL